MDELEDFYISLFSSKVSINGYNIRNGGSNGKHSEKSRKKMSKIMQGRYKGKDNPNYLSLNDNEIIKLYIEKKWSSTKIAEKMGCSVPAILNHLRDNGIEIRTRRTSQQNKGLFGFSGAHYHKRKQRWGCSVGYNRKKQYLGDYIDPLSAEIIYMMVCEEINER